LFLWNRGLPTGARAWQGPVLLIEEHIAWVNAQLASQFLEGLSWISSRALLFSQILKYKPY